MNTFYVTASISLLLVFAGFNHAHGLTTFGKSATSTPAPRKQQVIRCESQINCFQNTTCIHHECLCGDGSYPVLSKCVAAVKGPRHICMDTNECVDGAECITNSTYKGFENYKLCLCTEGFIETETSCSEATTFLALPGLLLLFTSFSRVLQ